MLDREVREKFKEFQEKTGKYGDLDIDDVRFEKVQLSNSKYFEINPKKSEIDEALLEKNIDVSFVPLANINPFIGEIEKFEVRKILDVKKGYTYFKENDVIFTKVTPSMENGNFAIAKNLINGIGFGSSEYHVFRCKNVHNKLLWFLFRADFFRDRAKKTMKGSGGLKRVPLEFFDTQYIPIPKDLNKKYTSYIIQEIIVEFLEAWKIGYTDIHRERVNKKKPILETIKKILVPNTFKYDKFLIEKFNIFAKNNGYTLKLEKLVFKTVSLSNTQYFDFIKGKNKYIKRYIIQNEGDYPVLGSSLKNNCISAYIKPIESTDIIDIPCVSFNKDNAKGSIPFFRNYPFLMDRHHIAIIPTELINAQYLEKILINYFLKMEFGWGENVATVDEVKKHFILIPEQVNDYSSKELQILLVDFWKMIIDDINNQLKTYDRTLELADKIDQAFLYRTFSKIDWSRK